VTVRSQRLFRWPSITSLCGIRVVVLPSLPPLAETSITFVISDEVAAAAFGLCEELGTLIDLLRHRSLCAIFHCLVLIFYLFGPKNKKKNKKLVLFIRRLPFPGCHFR
jgi:hypothetical protein